MQRKLGLVAAAGLVAALALVATACGGAGDPNGGVASLTPTTGQSSESQDSGGNDGVSQKEREEALLKYARCMREHGVDVPDPSNGRFELKARRSEARKVAAAQEACRDILKDAAPQLSEEKQAEVREAALKFAKCMRDHGVDMPDPKFQAGGGVLMQMPQGLERDPDLEAAQKACQPILQAVEPGGSATTGS
jgi:hypothetical protein